MVLLGESPVVVVSPHFDDATFSCGRLLSATPGSHVVNVFTGGPDAAPWVTEWDRRARMFDKGDDIPAIRASEDDEALALVGAVGHRLGVWDEQYRQRRVPLAWLRPGALARAKASLDDPAVTEEVSERLADVFSGLPRAVWCVPMGLSHGDHKKTAEACLRLAVLHPATTWAIYEDLPYSLQFPELVDEAKSSLKARGFEISQARVVEGATSGPSARAKWELASCYRSQVVALGDALVDLCVGSPEKYWWLRPPSARDAESGPAG